MSTQTDKRDINVLLALDTYQGMTDEEIEEIIEYRATQKFYDLNNLEAKESMLIWQNEQTEYLKSSLQIAQEGLEYMIGRSLAFSAPKQPTLITFDNTEVNNG